MDHKHVNAFNHNKSKRAMSRSVTYFSDEIAVLREEISSSLHDLDDSKTISINDSQLTTITNKEINWSRFNREFVLIRPDARPDDIIQGMLGNCWLLSALALVVQHERLLSNILRTSSDQFANFSRAHVRLFNNGRWHSIHVDDWLPCNHQGKLIFSKAKRNQLFVPLIEKAMAKLHGGYHRLIGGYSSRALTSLTGYPCEVLRLPSHLEPSSPHVEHSEFLEFWLKILSYNSVQFLMTVSCGRNHFQAETEYKKLGLLLDHAYSILDVVSIGNLQLVQLRNPWGTQAWRGDWSEGSTLWTAKLKRQLKSKASVQEGIFWISFNDLCRYFEDLVVCKIQIEWFQYGYEGYFPMSLKEIDQWASVFEIRIESRHVTYVQMMATLFQNSIDQQDYQRPCAAIMVVIFELLSCYTSYVLGPFIGASVCNIQTSVTCEAELKQDRRYLLAAFAFDDTNSLISIPSRPKLYRDYVLRIYSSKALMVDSFEPNPALWGDLIIHYVLSCGKAFKKRNIVTYHLNQNWPGLISVVENRHTQQWLQVSMKSTLKSSNIKEKPLQISQYQYGIKSCLTLQNKSMVIQDAKENINYGMVTCDLVIGLDHYKYLEDHLGLTITSRGSMETYDMIPPGHCQVINIIMNPHCQLNKHIFTTMSFKFRSHFYSSRARKSFGINNIDETAFYHEPDITKTYGLHSVRPIIEVKSESP